MYTNKDLQSVQLFPGSNYVTVSSATPSWPQQNVHGSNVRNGKAGRGGLASKTAPAQVQALTQVAFIDASTGNLMATAQGPQGPARSASSSAQSSSHPGIAPQGQPTTGLQVQSYTTGPPQPQPLPQVLQVQPGPAGHQVYKLTNGTRVVKAGQPYPKSAIVQTAVAVPPGPQQLGVVTVRPQNIAVPQQVQLVQSVQLQPGSTLQLAAAGPPQPQQVPAGQTAKVTLVHQAQPQQHVLVAQPQQTLHTLQAAAQQQQQAVQQQLQQQQQVAKQQQVAAAAAAAAGSTRPQGPTFQGIAVRPAAIRPVNGGPITIQQVYAAPPALTTVVRPTMRIPKLSTVATYNPVTGVRSATTSTTPGGVVSPVLPAGLPATLVQQVQKANLLQQQQQAQVQKNGLQAVVQLQQAQATHGGQQPRTIGSVLNANGAAGQRQTAVVLSGSGPGGGIAVVSGGGQPPHLQLGGPLQQQGGPQQQQLVNITLADGTTATTVMDQATITRMLSESSRGQAVKLQQAQQQQRQPGAGGVTLQQVPVQTLTLAAGPQGSHLQQPPQQPGAQQPQQVLHPVQQHVVLQGPSPQSHQGSSMVRIMGGGGAGAGMFGSVPAGVGLAGGSANGLDSLGGLQPVQLSAGLPGHGGVQLLVRNNSDVMNPAMRGLAPPPCRGQGLQIRGGFQLVGPGGEVSQQQNQHHLQHARSADKAGGGEGGEGGSRLDRTSMAFAQAQLQVQHQAQQQQHQQQQRTLASMVEGLSVVDLDAFLEQQNHHHQHQQALAAFHQHHQHLQRVTAADGGLAGMLSGGAGTGGLQELQHQALSEDAFAALPAVMTDVADPAAAARAQVGGGGSTAAAGGATREDLKTILVSIGQELARHRISVETAVTSGWLGVLTAMDVAVLADAYTEEKRRVTQQQNLNPNLNQQSQGVGSGNGMGPQLGGFQQQQQQQQVVAAAAAAAAAMAAAQSPQPQTSLSSAAAASLGVGADGGAVLPLSASAAAFPDGASASAGDSRRGSSGDRSNPTGLLGLTSSSARTSMSIAPSDDGAEAGQQQLLQQPAGPQYQHHLAPLGSGSGGPLGPGSLMASGVSGGYDRGAPFASFPFPYRLFGGGLTAMGDQVALGLEPDRLPHFEEHGELDAAALADVFGSEKPWAPFCGTLMAEELGLSAQGPLGGGGQLSGGAKLIDSASEYEARGPHGALRGAALAGPGQGERHFRLAAAAAGGGGGLHSASSQLSSGSLVGSSGGGGKGALGPAGIVGSGGQQPPARDSCGTSEVDHKEMEDRFANLDLGCGFY